MLGCFESPAGRYLGPAWQILVDVLSRYLAVLNSSINFVLYCLMGRHFRRELRTICSVKVKLFSNLLTEYCRLYMDQHCQLSLSAY